MRIDVDQEECTDGQAEAADIEHTQVSILNEYGEHEFVSDGMPRRRANDHTIPNWCQKCGCIKNAFEGLHK